MLPRIVGRRGCCPPLPAAATSTRSLVRRRPRSGAMPCGASMSSSVSAASPHPTTPGNDRRHKVLVVGGGRMGHIRASAFFGSRKTCLAGIVEESPERARELESLYPTPIFPNLDTALRTVPGLKGVWLSTPTPSHVAAIETVVGAGGLAVGIEKPVADNVQDIERCYAMAHGAGVPLYCSFQRRVDPSYQRLLAAVRAGEIGEVRSIHAVFRDHPVPAIEFLKGGGDIFHDLVVHDADFIMHLLRETPERAYATGSAFHPDLIEINVLSDAQCLLEFKSGVVATIDLSRSSPYGYDQRIEVFGSKGMLQVNNLPRTQVVTSSAQGVSHDNPVHSFPQRFHEAYLLEVDAFSDVMARATRPEVTVADSVNSTRVAEACRLSANRGQPLALEEVA